MQHKTHNHQQQGSPSKHMSMAARFPGLDKVRRKSLHRRNDSDEIDVFEAERYFSSINENLGRLGSQKLAQNIKEDYAPTRQNWRQGRASLDMPTLRHNHTLSQPQDTFLDTIKHIKDKKKHKQPSSPGGKLASFFNSLISQTVSKKKKSPSIKDTMVEDENSGGWRRRRRSSISHCRSSGSSATTRTTKTAFSDVETKSIQSCSSVSGFRTPPPYLMSTTANFRNYSDQKQVLVALPKCRYLEKNGDSSNLDEWLDQKSAKLVNGSSEKRNSAEFKSFLEEDGAESDSSSDLFELQLNYDHHKLGCCASGLPVYESTHMEGMKISSGNPITNGPFRS